MPAASLAGPSIYRKPLSWQRLLCLGLGTVFVSYMTLYVVATVQRPGPYPVGDFFGLWSYGQVLIQDGASRLYDFDALHAAQVAMGMDPGVHNPFPYPPTLIPFLWPTAALPYALACLLWLAATGGLYLLAVRTTGFGTWLAVLAPATTLTIVAGQTGFLTAFLLVGGLRLRARRPLLAGLLFGLLTIKPQFGLMVPVVLLATRDWRSIAATCATVAALALGATALLGPAIWSDWLASLPRYAAWFDALSVRNLMPTVTMNLRILGVPDGVASAVQAGVALLAAALVWIAARRFPPGLAIAMASLGTCLATPHAFVYDLPLLTAAVVLAIDARQHRGFSAGEVGVLVLVLVFPAAMAFGSRLPLATIAYAAFAVTLCRWGLRDGAVPAARSGMAVP